jgi:hypothetical protein
MRLGLAFHRSLGGCLRELDPSSLTARQSASIATMVLGELDAMRFRRDGVCARKTWNHPSSGSNSWGEASSRMLARAVRAARRSRSRASRHGSSRCATSPMRRKRRSSAPGRSARSDGCRWRPAIEQLPGIHELIERRRLPHAAAALGDAGRDGNCAPRLEAAARGRKGGSRTIFGVHLRRRRGVPQRW